MPQAPTVALPKRLPLVITPENRAETPDKDARLVNAYCEKTKEGDYHIFRRPGLLQDYRPSGANDAGMGLFNWLGDIYAVVGGTLYKNTTNIGAVDGTNGVYRFDSCLGATPKLVLGNGVKAYTYDSGGGLVEITDGDFPDPFVKGWAYLDGTTYVATPTAHIQGSGINDPQSWDPVNDILAQIEPDRGVALGKQLVYVVIFKQWSVEIFYDAGNASGSPLGPVQGAKVNYGLANEGSLQQIDGAFFWISTNQSASSQVMKMDGLKVEPISDDPVERLLGDVDLTNTVYSLQLKDNGHRFYIITSPSSNLTLAYDLDQKMWSQWTDEDGNYFPYVASSYNAATLRHLFQHESNGRIYEVSASFYTDDGEIITVDVYTPNFDGEIDRRKQMNRLTFDADQVVGSILQVRVNDNDYQPDKWSNFRNVDLSQKLPTLMNCGTFIRRAHNLRHQKATFFRLRAVNMQLDVGTL